MKRGLRTDHVYFHSFPFTGDKAKEKTLALAQTISRWAPDPVFVHVVSLTKVQEAIGKTGEDSLRVIVLRRFMYRLAQGLARRFGHRALVTGEAVGQVASQTIENLRCVETVVPDMLVLRPLVGFDKKEIIARAREIATFETSILPHEDCCSLFAPRRPSTRGTPEQCAEVEAKLDVAGLEAEALATFEAYRIVRGSEPTLVPHTEPRDDHETDAPEHDEPEPDSEG
jgi:thiamine biosynthesis protein ThiI